MSRITYLRTKKADKKRKFNESDVFQKLEQQEKSGRPSMGEGEGEKEDSEVFRCFSIYFMIFSLKKKELLMNWNWKMIMEWIIMLQMTVEEVMMMVKQCFNHNLPIIIS